MCPKFDDRVFLFDFFGEASFKFWVGFLVKWLGFCYCAELIHGLAKVFRFEGEPVWVLMLITSVLKLIRVIGLHFPELILHLRYEVIHF